MTEIPEDVEGSVHCITASLITLLAVLIVFRLFQRKFVNSHEKEQENKVESSEETASYNDIDDLLIKPEEIEEIEESSMATDECGDEGDGGSDFRCESLQGKLKQVRHKKIKEKLEGDMTETQINAESEARKTQLEAIFKLMEQSKDTFGIEDMTEVKDQLKLYAIN
ncbi:uncharacterized protein [Antedon mediterranea]|uniref:uncharacterized protein n=1 Tax=Antedon mediterranea TaxID=105859 RepID=UPI003AF9306D